MEECVDVVELTEVVAEPVHPGRRVEVLEDRVVNFLLVRRLVDVHPRARVNETE